MFFTLSNSLLLSLSLSIYISFPSEHFIFDLALRSFRFIRSLQLFRLAKYLTAFPIDFTAL